MDFRPNDDQAMFLSVLGQMVESAQAAWKVSPDWARFDWSPELDATLEENGFYDGAAEESLGLVMAAAMTYRVAALPVLVECAASSTLRPLYAADLPRPIAVAERDAAGAIAYLPVAKSLIVIGDHEVRTAILGGDAIAKAESLFAYPMGVLKSTDLAWKTIEADPRTVRDTWRVAVAAELAGVLKGGLDAVVAHVRERHQFGRPLGSFQAVQHRLAAAAIKIEAAYWLTLKAAQRHDAADGPMALGYLQDASAKIVYDLHQFMGAMGLTLEHPLHRWTYRARLLRSSLGGAAANLRAVSASRWQAA